MTTTTELLPLIGGVSGLLFIAYGAGVLYFARRKEKLLERHLQAINNQSVELGIMKGMLLGLLARGK